MRVVGREPAQRALGAWLDADAAIEPLGAGHINDTWLVRHDGRSYVLQRISDAVFPDPIRVAGQVAEVVAFLEAGHGQSSGVAVPSPGPSCTASSRVIVASPSGRSIGIPPGNSESGLNVRNVS